MLTKRALFRNQLLGTRLLMPSKAQICSYFSPSCGRVHGITGGILSLIRNLVMFTCICSAHCLSIRWGHVKGTIYIFQAVTWRHNTLDFRESSRGVELFTKLARSFSRKNRMNRALSLPPFPQPPPLLCSLFALCLTCSPLPRSRSVCHQTVSDMWSHFHASRWPFKPSYIPIVHPEHADCIGRVFL